ncbi:MAG: hypothetical protein CV087_17705 [Candidatus Brocadia sp. WS118]|nr:MAG: hypothetical protein CV087_17705 [Candidatus Brocadia sp. WS118]
MKFKVPDNIRLFLSSKYLDWAETLPKFNSGFIHELQIIREHQRRESKKEYERSRPPKGVEFLFLYFRLIEIFHIEEFDNFQKGLIRLLPGLQDDFYNRNFQTEFRHFTESISGGGYKKLGLIRREGKRIAFFHKPVCEIRDLPPEVDYISISIHKALPSAVEITLDVHLTHEATKHLLELQEKHYLSRIRFRSLFPWKMKGYTEDYIGSIISQQILEWINNLRINIELCIRPYIKGYFMQQITGKKPCLPAIEVYGMKGLPEGEEAFDTLRNESRGWLSSLGLEFYRDIYGDGKSLFVWSHTNTTKTDNCTAHRLIVLWESYLKTLETKHYGGEISAIIHNTKYALDAILPCIAVIEFLRTAQRNIEKLRMAVFDSIKLRPFSRYKLNKYIKLNNVVKQESMILERTSMEFNERIKYIHYKMKSIEDMKIIKKNPNVNEVENLKDVSIEFVKFDIDRLKKSLSLVTNSFSEFLSTRNMEVMYRLQLNIFWLTIVVTIATIVGLLANWASIKVFLKMFLQYLSIL